VTNFRGSRRGIRSIGGAGGSIAGADAMFADGTSNVSGRGIEEGNVIEAGGLLPPAGADKAGTKEGTGPFNLRTGKPILATNELVTMSVGSIECDGSYLDGSTQRMVFECPAEGLLSVGDGEQITVGSGRTRWNFGRFSSELLK